MLAPITPKPKYKNTKVNVNLKKFSPKFFVKTSYSIFWNALIVFRNMSPITVNGIEIANILKIGDNFAL